MFDLEKKKILDEMKISLKGAFLAGGALTSTFSGKEIHDFDIYFKSKDDLLLALEEMYMGGGWCVSVTKRAITFQVKKEANVQLMTFDFFDSAEKIFDRFDFTCCMAALDLDSGNFSFHPRFFADLAKRQLVFNHRTLYPLASGMRVFKFLGRGYKIDKIDFLKVLMSCNFKDVDNWEDLADQIGGVYGNIVSMDDTKPFDLENAINAISSASWEGVTEQPVIDSWEKALVYIDTIHPTTTVGPSSAFEQNTMQ
jgi:hypothetical protein